MGVKAWGRRYPFGESWLNTRRDQVREALKTLPQGLPIWDANHVGRLGRKVPALPSRAVGGLLPAGPANPLPAETNRNGAGAINEKPASTLSRGE